MTIKVMQSNSKEVMERINEASEEYQEVDSSEIGADFERSDLFQKIARQKEHHSVAVALFSDFDGTLFSGDISRTAELVKSARQKEIPIIAATGRGALALKDVIDDLVAAYNLDHPDKFVEEINFDAIIGAVGTEIFIAQSKDGKTKYERDEEYEKQMIQRGFVRSEIAKKAAESITDLTQTHPDFEVSYQGEFAETEKWYLDGDQTAHVQPFKISLKFFAKSPEEIDFITKYFKEKFPAQRIVICESIGYNSGLTAEDHKRKYCLDILPVTKADAVDYLAKKIGVNHGLVAGDSGNDSTMLADSEKLDAVLVGGHKDEARFGIDRIISDDPNRRGRKFQKISTSSGGSKRIYIGENDKIGPDSIIHVTEAYERAKRIKAIREARTSGENIEQKQ